MISHENMIGYQKISSPPKMEENGCTAVEYLGKYSICIIPDKLYICTEENIIRDKELIKESGITHTVNLEYGDGNCYCTSEHCTHFDEYVLTSIVSVRNNLQKAVEYVNHNAFSSPENKILLVDSTTENHFWAMVVGYRALLRYIGVKKEAKEVLINIIRMNSVNYDLVFHIGERLYSANIPFFFRCQNKKKKVLQN